MLSVVRKLRNEAFWPTLIDIMVPTESEEHESIHIPDISDASEANRLIRPQKVLPFDLNSDLASDDKTVRKEYVVSPPNGKSLFQHSANPQKITFADKIMDILNEVKLV